MKLQSPSLGSGKTFFWFVNLMVAFFVSDICENFNTASD
jgi:hypothetical protein